VSERLFIATLDGGLGYIMPVPEKTYRRLLMLQNVLVSQGAHIAGLNPKAFR
jgi:cleavage and polyadenylation specificity factor subunit 1